MSFIIIRMKILTVDVGTGTQDIFLYDSKLDLENGFKLVVPSPTMILFRRLQEATRAGQAVLLEGVIMGGGPSQWAVEAHLKAGLAVYATPQAARSFNDDLDKIREMGIQLVSEDEARRLSPAAGPAAPGAARLRFPTDQPGAGAFRHPAGRPGCHGRGGLRPRQLPAGLLRPPVPLRLPGRAHPGREPPERLRLPGRSSPADHDPPAGRGAIRPGDRGNAAGAYPAGGDGHRPGRRAGRHLRPARRRHAAGC